MKTPLFVLAATGALCLSFAAPGEAQAGSVNLDIHIGVPAVVHPPRVIYHQPVVVYPAPVVRYHAHAYRPVYYHARHPYWRHAYAYPAPSYGYDKRIARVEIDPRLSRR